MKDTPKHKNRNSFISNELRLYTLVELRGLEPLTS